MKVTIIGGGFGLYGYLPALIDSCRVDVILPARYKERLQDRADIRHYIEKIEWMDDEGALLTQCDGAVVAQQPARQVEWVERCLAHKNISYLFLEKPLAPSPDSSISLLDTLQASGKKFRIGFNFRYMPWGKDLLRDKAGIKNVVWTFHAHHYAKNVDTWKRQHGAGGGALRFYGIHVVALLAEIGYDAAQFSKIGAQNDGEADSWEAEITGPGLPPCHVLVDSRKDENKFIIEGMDNKTELSGPFATLPQDGVKDQRIPLLTEGLLDLFSGPEIYYDWYSRSNKLWHSIEEKTL